MHEVKARELELLAFTLKSIARYAGQWKNAKDGPRPESLNHAAKEGLTRGLTDLMLIQERPVSHLRVIAQIVHEWATGKPKDGKWGGRAANRARK